MDDWGGCIVGLIALALVIYAISLVVAGGSLALAFGGLSAIIGIEYCARGLAAIGVSNPTVAWLILGILIGGAVGSAIGFARAGQKSAVPVAGGAGGLLIALMVLVSGFAPPVVRETKAIAPAAVVAPAPVASEWRGVVGNSPATLNLIQQANGGWSGRMTTQGVIEELAVKMEEGGAIVLSGRSFRRIQGSGAYYLDTFRGQFLANGIKGSYTDTAGRRGQWSVTAVTANAAMPASIPSGAPPASGANSITVAGNPSRGPSTIQVDSATYGASCRVPAGNDTENLAGQCNGKEQCTYSLQNRPGGDPAYGCQKDYAAQYHCSGDSSNLRGVSHPAVKNELYSLYLDCRQPSPEAATSAAPSLDTSKASYRDRICDGANDRQANEILVDHANEDIVEFSVDLHLGCFSGYVLVPESWKAYTMEAGNPTENWWMAYKWYPKNSGSGERPPLSASELSGRHTSQKIRVQGNGSLLFRRLEPPPGPAPGPAAAAAGARGGKGVVYRVGGAVSTPEVIHKVEGDYSPEARAAKLQGKVGLQFVVAADGSVTDVQVVRSLGMGLDEKAVEAVKQWRFKPAMKDNRPVPVLVGVEMVFRLL